MSRRRSFCTVVAACAAATIAVSAPASAAKKKPAAKAAAKSAPAPKPVEKAQEKPAENAIDAAPAAADKTPPPPEKKSDNAPTEVKKDDLDFDLLGETKPLSAEEKLKNEEIAKASKTRRAVLQTHTALGFVLLGVLATNTLLGTLNYWDKFAGGGFTQRFELAHRISWITATAVFATQAGLALFAPDPFPKPGRWDTARVHRILMTSAAVGMGAQIVLGLITAFRYGNLDQRDLARAHLAIGYVTYGLAAAGAITWLF
ncbi:MAG: hypothetical protein IT381_18695 [Deltaproteobacteria bacterium]|nr:hypothetical protein [Deltaproteobacteria bacterium]